MRLNTTALSAFCLTIAAVGCSSSGETQSQTGGVGPGPSSGGAPAAGGTTALGGTTASGGTPGSGGAAAFGGTPASGGLPSTGGQATGGSTIGQGGRGSGGSGTSGAGGLAGASSSGGAGVAGAAGSDAGPDCNAPMPTGGTDHCGQNTQGSAAGLSWSLWSNKVDSNACITTYSTPAFSAKWSGNNDFLARIGLEFGNAGKTYDQYGSIKASFSYKKTGDAGGYSYIGIYGWSTDPCVEWYIVDDRWGTMPFNAYQATLKGTAKMDGADYKLFQNKTKGSGGSRCSSSITEWDQFWSIRQSARQCGVITISDHFKAWNDAGMKLGKLLEAKILVETGGGTGSIEFPVANVTATP